jgi:NADH-quinone oxidoreductase subunit A
MGSEYSAIGVFLIIGIGFVALAISVPRLLRPSRPSRQKLANYECGERPVGPAWVQFRVIFYIFALIFVVFDVEAVFVIPWACVLRQLKLAGLGAFAFWEMMAFIGILLVGWAYAWKKGAFQWE